MRRLSSVVGAGWLLISAVALAQPESPPPPLPPPPVEAAPADQPPGPPPPPPPLADAPGAPEELPKGDPGNRLRFGASAGFGTFVPGPMVNFALEGRIGWQFNNLLGTYLVVGRNEGLWFGGRIVTGSTAGASINVGFVSYTHVGAEVEAILGNHFFIAAGPHLANGGWGFVGMSGTGGGGGAEATQQAGVVSGWLPGVGTKIGVGFGKPNPTTGRRTGFSMMLSTMFVFGSGGVRLAQSGGTGGVSQIVAPMGGVGIAPMLLFGFESR